MKTRRDLDNQLLILDARLTGRLTSYRPALSLLKDELDQATSAEQLRGLTARLDALAEKIRRDAEAGLE